MYQQVQNKPTAAYVISLLGGIFGLIASLYVTIVMGIIALLAASEYSYYGFFDFTGMFLIYTVFGIWMLITSILVIVFARRLNSNPMQHSKYGAYIIIFSIIGVGGILGLIGGILALVYKPIPAGPPPAYTQAYAPQTYAQPQQPPQAVGQQGFAQAPPQQITRICPQCGHVVQENIKFCPHCGKQLN